MNLNRISESESKYKAYSVGTHAVFQSTVDLDPDSIYKVNINVAKNFKVVVRDNISQIVLSPFYKMSKQGELYFQTLSDTSNVKITVESELKTGDEVNVSFKLDYISHFKKFNNRINGIVWACIASIPSRKKQLKDTVNSLYHSVHKICVFLNGYDEVPDFLNDDERIEIAKSQEYGDNGDLNKFFWIDKKNVDIMLCCDDDLIYPIGYVKKISRKLLEYKKAVLGTHGIYLKQPIVNYYDLDSRYTFNFNNENSKDRVVQLLGTGTIAFSPKQVRFNKKRLEFKNSGDIWIAIQAKQMKVPLICLARPKEWIRQNKVHDSIWKSSKFQYCNNLNTEMIQTHAINREFPLTITSSKKMVFAIKTWNRLQYLKECIHTWMATKNNFYDWILIIADDGSTDGTLEYLDKLKIPHETYIIKNNRRYACGQLNSIISILKKLDFCLCFSSDDDVIFKKSGWDDLYINAVESSGYEHLCYLNKEHFVELKKKKSRFFKLTKPISDESGSCEAYIDVLECSGALFTITSDMIKLTGYTDEENFPIRGQWHIDYSIRCCRAGFNNEDFFYDACYSNDYIDLQENRPGYKCSLPWNEEYKKTKDESEMERRRDVILDTERVYVSNRNIVIKEPTVNDIFDKVFVINLDKRQDRLRNVVDQCHRLGIKFKRIKAINGKEEPYYSEWKRYLGDSNRIASEKVETSYDFNFNYTSEIARVHYIEEKVGRKAITEGAWGYLKSYINILLESIKENYKKILVLDDDVCFHQDFSEMFKNHLNKIPANWVIWQLGALQYDWKKEIEWLNKSIYLSNGTSVGSHATAIDNKAYVLLLHYCLKFDLPFDVGPMHYIHKAFPRLSFTSFPNLIIQDMSESDINSSVVSENESEKLYKWKIDDYMKKEKIVSADEVGSFQKESTDRILKNIFYNAVRKRV